MKTRTRLQLSEKVTGQKPFKTHDEGIKNEPISKFISFKEAQVTLEHEWRGSMEQMLKNLSVRYVVISPENGKARMIYKPDVVRLAKAIQKFNETKE